MPILLHLAHESSATSIRKAGIRAARWALTTSAGVSEVRGVFAFPVLESFAQTYQWVRELRRHHDERVIGVYLKLRDDEQVYVGRYGQPHELTSLDEGIRWVRAHPWGAQLVLPRRIAAREVHAIREVTQLVGWSGAPHDTRISDCVCQSCLPSGSRDILRKAKAYFQQHLRAARAASEVGEIVAALRSTENALERVGARVGIKPLRAFTQHAEPRVRGATAWILGLCRSDQDAAKWLERLTQDPGDEVAATAARGLLSVAGSGRFLTAAAKMSEPALVEVIDHLRYVPKGIAMLTKLETHSESVRARISANLASVSGSR